MTDQSYYVANVTTIRSGHECFVGLAYGATRSELEQYADQTYGYSCPGGLSLRYWSRSQVLAATWLHDDGRDPLPGAMTPAVADDDPGSSTEQCCRCGTPIGFSGSEMFAVENFGPRDGHYSCWCCLSEAERDEYR